MIPRAPWWDRYRIDLALKSRFSFMATATVSSFLTTPFIDQYCLAASHHGHFSFYSASTHMNAMVRAKCQESDSTVWARK